jgi:parvulin-like peptidyl-prolyl isomerase
MSFRNRPTLDRKHRPRWQDELRSQQLIVAGFALAMAVAIGIFAATAWSQYYATHLRQVATVNETAFTRADLETRMNIIGAGLQAIYLEIANRKGGMRDAILDQQLRAIEDEVQRIVSNATGSLVDGVVLNQEAARRGISVPDAELDAEVAVRRTLPTILQVALIRVSALPSGAAAADLPTDAQWAEAEAKANDLLAQLTDGADFAELARSNSIDSSSTNGGLIGWIEDGDVAYQDYFAAAEDAEAGDLIGPTRDATGVWILRLEARRDTGPDTVLADVLKTAGVTDAQYRDSVHDELLRQAFRDYFAETVLAQYLPQRHVAQIFIAAESGVPIPKQRIRHFLAQPIPGVADQSTATEEQWAAALARAEAFRAEASAPDADWASLALDSDDPGSRSRGGDLGWNDPLAGNFVPEFEDAVAELAVGELSAPVKTDYGYHVIQVTDTRTSPRDQVGRLLTEVREDPEAFAAVANRSSEDPSSNTEGGDIGWVLPYQLDAGLSTAIFDLAEAGQISDVVETGSGYYVFKAIEVSPARYVFDEQRSQVEGVGFARWFDELRSDALIWIDPAFGSTTAVS